MIWRSLFPKNGGGGLRRWSRVRQELFENSYINPKATKKEASDSSAMESFRHNPIQPLTIIDFKHPDDAADARSVDFGPTKGGWRLSDDEVIGGYSRGSLELVDFADNMNDDDDDSQKAGTNNDSLNGRPFIRWTGNVDTRIGPTSRAKRSGFCALRCPEFPFGIPLGGKYNALELNCRTDGRIYTVNLKVSSYFPDDLYQALITVDKETQKEHTKNKEFLTLVLPFQDFVLTSAGLVTESQRALDGGIKLESLGITIMDGEDGPFQFDLTRIRAVNYFDGMILGDDDEDRKSS